MTDEEIIQGLECCAGECEEHWCVDCPLYDKDNDFCKEDLHKYTLDLIKRQQTELENYSHNIRRLTADILEYQKVIQGQQAEIENIRKKALLDASTKFAGHSNYHGDTILCTLICMSEGQKVADAKPIDYFSGNQLKAEAIKKFAEKLKEKAFTHEIPFEANEDKFIKLVAVEEIDNLVKEMVGGNNA